MNEMPDRFLREAEVAVMTSLSRAQRWRLELRGEFPARIRLGGRTVVWSAREIDEWMQSRPRARYVPRGAILGPQHTDDEDKPDTAPHPTAGDDGKVGVAEDRPRQRRASNKLGARFS